ncbi:MAG: hypothetical protein HZB38_00170 [Planctomycetes bacterium]|nr:hypothetical protein [Planctomycetota bacterium]
MARLFQTSQSDARWSPQERVLFARASCLCFGIGLLLWSLAPIAIARIVSKEPPELGSLLLPSATMLLAGVFIGLYSLIRESQRGWIWMAFVLSCLFMGTGLAYSISSGFLASSSFVLFLSALTTFSTWLAVTALTRERREIIDAVTHPPGSP